MNNNENNNEIISMQEWFFSIIISGIPIVNIFLFILWVIDKDTNPNKKNWAKAFLLLYTIILIIGLLIYINYHQLKN